MEEIETGNFFSRLIGRFLFWLFERYLSFAAWYKPYDLWMELQWMRLWARYPILGTDLLHNYITMTAFILLLVGFANSLTLLIALSATVLAVDLVLGTVNIVYNPGGKNG